MMLRAIAIYERDEEDGSFTLIKSAKKEPDTLFFKNTVISDFEKMSLQKMMGKDEFLSSDGIMADKSNQEYYYMQWIPERRHLLVVMSARVLDKSEACYLLININHVDVRSDKVKTTLNDIVVNPIGYTGRDIFTQAILQNVNDLKVVAINTKNLVMERGVRIQTLDEKSEDLFASSVEFKERAEELKNSYTCCGGVKNAINNTANKMRIVK